MHELHIVERVVRQALEIASARKAIKVTKIRLALGEFFGLKEDPIRLYFGDLSKGTILEGAELVIRQEKPKLKCSKCNYVFEREGNNFNCPKCRELAGPANADQNLYIEDIEIELP